MSYFGKLSENVLMQKLQLDLIPYASREFKKVEKEKMHFLFPYIDSLFGEIFSCERKYVMFCSDFFDTLFRMYSDDKEYTGSVEFGKKEEWALFFRMIEMHVVLPLQLHIIRE